MTKHTPGPWVVFPEEPDKDYLRIRGTTLGQLFKIANVPIVNIFARDAYETIANARLIAAAPDLLEALIWMVQNDDTNEGDEPVDSLGGQTWNEYNAYWIDGLNRARAAIAKATGQEATDGHEDQTD